MCDWAPWRSERGDQDEPRHISFAARGSMSLAAVIEKFFTKGSKRHSTCQYNFRKSDEAIFERLIASFLTVRRVVALSGLSIKIYQIWDRIRFRVHLCAGNGTLKWHYKTEPSNTDGSSAIMVRAWMECESYRRHHTQATSLPARWIQHYPGCSRKGR
ncbi:hypothetical protein LX36DRAFT_376830 [Colletotrichum falcatum]|nr:hypothetical protein LX36DRAFT_376830 [Colletotrichum falcatum]